MNLFLYLDKYFHPYNLLPIFGLLIFDTIAMSYITTYSKSLYQIDLLKALFYEGLAWVFLVLMLRSKGLGRSNAIWDIGSLILVTSIAVLQFKEKIWSYI